jgi:dimethylhistidine N-methyltransferase
MYLDDVAVCAENNPGFRSDVLTGFAMRPQRTVPPRWLYDRRGSELFEEITQLPEYYPSRTEIGLLRQYGEEIGALVGQGRALVEFGSGSSVKTPLMLRAVDPVAYVPIDISSDFLHQSASALAARFPDLPVLPLEADFSDVLTLPREVRELPKLGFFPGSTLGNMTVDEAVALLEAMRTTLGADAALLIGLDRVKDKRNLVRAYDDAQGITAAFNLNLLHRINRELDADIPVESFRHVVRWNPRESRIEMHLEATRDVTFAIDRRDFTMAAGETVHTENSYKYSPEGARLLLLRGGWSPVRLWSDTRQQFAIILATAAT